MYWRGVLSNRRIPFRRNSMRRIPRYTGLGLWLGELGLGLDLDLQLGLET